MPPALHKHNKKKKKITGRNIWSIVKSSCCRRVVMSLTTCASSPALVFGATEVYITYLKTNRFSSFLPPISEPQWPLSFRRPTGQRKFLLKVRCWPMFFHLSNSSPAVKNVLWPFPLPEFLALLCCHFFLQ